MHQFTNSTFQIALSLVYALLSYCCEGTSINLSPLGMVSVCPGGQVLLTCERTSGIILYWNVSAPHPAGATISPRLVLNQGVILSPVFKIGFTEFNITRTSESPLISQLLINNVTTVINGSIIYCSQDSNGNNASMAAINVHKDEANLQSSDGSLNVTLVNQVLRRGDTTVTLQWPREAGAVYHINVLPEITHIQLTTSHDICTINLTVSYDNQYCVSIVSSLCGVTTTKVLMYVTCNYPPTRLLHHPIVVVTGPQDNPPIEGQIITFTCAPGFVLTGPSMSACVWNGEWEPDPGEVDCIADCGVPLVNSNIKLDYTSTLEGSILILTCENETSNSNTTDQRILNVTCHSNGSWIPSPTDFIKSCSSVTTVSPLSETSPGTTVIQIGAAVFSSTVIIVCAVSSIVFLSIGYAWGRFGNKHKQLHTSKEKSRHDEGSQQPQTPGPLYEELQQKSTLEHQDLVELNENVAYGPIIAR